MPNDILNFNKPCSACRRRKVRCDKAQPCNNCVRHGVSCVYEAPRESAMRQQLLHDRIERLERIIEDMAALSQPSSALPSTAPRLSQRSSCSSGNSPFSSSDDFSDIPADAGSQVFGPGDSFHMGPDSWLNIDQFASEPRYLLDINMDQTSDEGLLSWPLASVSPKPRDMTSFHLPVAKEDSLILLFFDHVEPFIRTCHQGNYWQLVTDYRQGTCASSREVEALMFATQYITATVLPAEVLQECLGMPKSGLRSHFQKATELALDRANLMRSRNTILFNALLYYITCQFHVGNCEVGSTLLGLAGNIARRIGMHKDPAYYGYSAWIVEMRRRMWGHLATLDAQAAQMDGSEALLTTLGDVQRSLNANDVDWNPSHLVDNDPGPPDREGFSDSAVPLMWREVSRTYHSISDARKTTANCEDLVAIVDETEKYLHCKFITHFDGSEPMHLVITHWCNAMIKSLHVSVLYFHASPSRLKLQCHVFEQLQDRLFDDCLACLEEFERGENAATPHHWQWAFRWPMPIHVVAGLLSGLARQPSHADSDRAWKQIDAVFRRYSNEDISMDKIPAWKSIEDLCDQAILKHSTRVHEGRAYTKRIHKASSPSVPSCGAWEPLKGAPVLSYHDVCSAGLYPNAIPQPNIAQMFSSEAMNLGFTVSEIDAIFFNLNENNEFPSIDI